MSSLRLMFLVFFALALGAALGTFIENDFGSEVARKLVYYSWWYQSLLVLGLLNLLVVTYKTKLYRHFPRFVFHFSFFFILLGAVLTHFFGDDGVLKIREGSSKSTYYSNSQKQDIDLPFTLRLDDFKLERYYGSRSPSEYSSDVYITDKQSDEAFGFTISMNQTLSYKGYKFFQTFYDPDELGSILSVNRDPGVHVTYVGYFLLFLGLILNFFDKKSRFYTLLSKIRQTSLGLIFILGASSFAPLYANSPYIEAYLREHLQNSAQLSEAFSTLVVQSRMGRMKPFGTLSTEVLYKISGKNSLYGFDSTQILLGMFSRADIWQKVPLIRVKTPKLKKFIGIKERAQYASFADFFDDVKRYKLESKVQEALMLKPSKRGTFENDILKVDEKLNISFMVYKGLLFKLFPSQEQNVHTWMDFEQMWQSTTSNENTQIRKTSRQFIDAMFARDYENATLYTAQISQYQREFGNDIIPSVDEVKRELLLNKLMIFERLSLVYMLLALVLLFVSFGQIFNKKYFPQILSKYFFYIVLFLFAVHSFGLAARWLVSGHAPFSDTYESIVYIAWSCLLFSVLFLRKSLFALCASVLMAGIFMFVAHLGHIDAEITNLVPVLKSFWLSIHVSIITASYGFLALGAALGIMTLLLFVVRKRDPKIDAYIRHISDINELTLLIGLVLLVIGNFLGGIWANESWGRYWGWDPKETWAYISILIYAIILHLRLVAKLYSPYIFALLSSIGFASILMTYFGVNFYLAGMHSYATGDPVPIPAWVYWGSGFMALLIVFSYPNKNLKEKNEKD